MNLPRHPRQSVKRSLARHSAVAGINERRWRRQRSATVWTKASFALSFGPTKVYFCVANSILTDKILKKRRGVRRNTRFYCYILYIYVQLLKVSHVVKSTLLLPVSKIHSRRPSRFLQTAYIFVCSKKQSNLAQTLKYISNKMSGIFENIS